MKNVYYTLIVVCLLLVFGCKKDKEVIIPEDLKTQIVGRWKIISASARTFVNNVEDMSEREDDTSFTENDYFEFTSTEIATSFVKNKKESGKYYLDET